MKIAHLTSVHPRYDTRIFLKQCRSLARNGYDVSLVVADGKGDEQKDGISIYDVGQDTNRLKRMLHATRRVLQKAVSLDADLYHIHDPELIPAGLRLKRKGKKVVFDSHEDVPLQILGKPYLSFVIKRFVSKTISVYESFSVPRFDAIVAATPAIRDKFLKINENSIDINNYPILDELENSKINWSEKQNQVCYLGGYTAARGLKELVQSVSLLNNNTKLSIGGKFFEGSFEIEMMKMPGWQLVNNMGFLDREGVRNLLHESIAGLVTLHPLKNYLDALPVKMFEYMSAGIPVIASDFPLWKEIIEKNNCGICVDPTNPKAIAEAIDYMVTHPDKAQEMGENGRKAVENKYNWEIEEQKLLKLYQDLLGNK